MNEHPSIHDIAHFLERWAPPSSAQSYDNVGLQVGNPDTRVSSALLALDMTPAVLDEALAIHASLIITHHPLIFKPLRSITSETFVSNLALRLAAEGIALYSVHTNLDAASGGVSFALARQLGLDDLEFLAPLEGESDDVGMGAIGTLEAPCTLEAFLTRVADRLDTPSIRYVGDLAASVERVAVCGGAGSDLVSHAVLKGADAFVTADVKYHSFFDALDLRGRPKLAYIDAGHYETEAITETLLAHELGERFPDTIWRCTQTRTSPVRSFVAPS